MKFTLALPMCPPDHLLPLARAAEDAGWDAVTMPDSVFFPEEVSADYPYTADGARFWRPDTPWLEPFVAIPAMAAITERLHFYTNVYKTVLRHPLLVAKSLGSAAALAPGRVGIGVGLSWIPEEFAWLGQDMRTRGKRLDETIDIIRAVLAGGYAEHHGAQYDFGRLAMSPAPPAPVPIYVGGHSDPALRRAARLGDGWIAVQVTPEEIDEIMGRLRPLLIEHDRDVASYEIKVTPLVLATPDAMASLGDQGVTDVITVPWLYYEGDHHELQTKLDGVHRFADEVIHPLAEPTGVR
ncbi:MAG: TIGR03619 family F420-dependent LLM class oxidoreductase [Acidimicrobiales bacterium]